MRKISSVVAVLAVMVSCTTLLADDMIPPIEKIEFGKGDHLVVNGQPFLPASPWRV